MNLTKLFTIAAMGSTLFWMAGCSSVPTNPTVANGTHYLSGERLKKARTKSDSSYWDGAGMSGSPKIVVSLAKQKAFFYKGGKLAGVTVISSGRKGLETVSGHFSVTQKDRHHASSLYGEYVNAQGNVIKRNVNTRKDKKPPGAKYEGAPMPYFMRFKGGYGMHAGYLPGYAASHGCVRMPNYMARHFYENASVGTPVIVKQ